MILFPSIVEAIMVDYCWEFNDQYIAQDLSKRIVANGVGSHVWVTSKALSIFDVCPDADLYPLDVVSGKRKVIACAQIFSSDAMRVADNGTCYYIAPDRASLYSFSPINAGVIEKRGEVNIDANAWNFTSLRIMGEQLVVRSSYLHSTRDVYRANFIIQSDDSLTPCSASQPSPHPLHTSDYRSPNGIWRLDRPLRGRASAEDRNAIDSAIWEIALNNIPVHSVEPDVDIGPLGYNQNIVSRALWGPDSRSVLFQTTGGRSIRVYFQNSYLDR